jgi:hypothetical protein
MKYFLLEPEVAGHFGDHAVVDESTRPPTVSHFHFEFDAWSGDHFISTRRTYLGTETMKGLLKDMQPPVSGVEFGTVEISKSPEYYWLQKKGSKEAPSALPQFVWFKITGRAGADDFGTPAQYGLVVSERILQALQSLKFENCKISEYEKNAPASM